MWRAPVTFTALLCIALFEFSYFPGHTYLASSSQVYVAGLEHLRTPGYLSRDLAATHPSFTLTVYDELTLFLTSIDTLSLRDTLLLEHLASRIAGIFGLFYLARAIGLHYFPAMLVSAILSAGTFLPGPAIWVFDPEPTPAALALGPLLLAMGLFARSRMMPAGFFAGCALLLDPALASPFWMLLILAFIFDRRLRPQLRPLAPVLLVFVLLLANLAQLQPGPPDSQPVFSKLSTRVIQISQFRSPEHWVSLWSTRSVYLYIAVFVLAVAVITRLWDSLNRPTRWITLFLSSIGLSTLPLSALLLDRLHMSAVLAGAPLRLVVFTTLLTWFLLSIAGWYAFRRQSWLESVCWSLPAILLFLLPVGHSYRPSTGPPVGLLAGWARANTWGSSMFLFPDAAKASYPGVFRAQSLRPVWVDWQSGAHLDHDPTLAPEWFARWQTSMQDRFSGDRLQELLSLPVDYFVFNRSRTIEAKTREETRLVQPVFVDAHFAAYEASTLRSIPGRLLVDGR
jgi:hypothetical protein